MVISSAGLSAASIAQAAAETAAKAALLAYTKANQDFILSAGLSVTKLTQLREETVKYYEAQKALAGLMTTSAASLNSTTAAYRFSILTDAQKQASMRAQFSAANTSFAADQVAYNNAKASGDANAQIALGTDMAKRADAMNALINPLIAGATATGTTGEIANWLAVADSVSAALLATAPATYQSESLASLALIDTSLATLDFSLQQLATVFSDAGKATLNGLAAVVKAISGSLPSTTAWSGAAFADGGAYQGGLALVGERGPELINFGQPGQVYTAPQTRAIFGSGGSGDNSELVAEVRALHAELRAIAVNTGGMHKLLKRVTPDGNSLQMVVAA